MDTEFGDWIIIRKTIKITLLPSVLIKKPYNNLQNGAASVASMFTAGEQRLQSRIRNEMKRKAKAKQINHRMKINNDK